MCPLPIDTAELPVVPGPGSTGDAGTPFGLDAALGRLGAVRRLLVYMHDNPDPDALAAAVGLKSLFEHVAGAQVNLALGGIVGRAENRAMVEALKIPLLPVEELTHTGYDRLAIVDSQPGTGNNSLPTGRIIDVVVDHHSARPESAASPWCDIRSHLGATSTIVLQYLREKHVRIDASLATALFYALRTETRDLGREATQAEREAYLFLVPRVDHQMLYRISHPKVPRDHFAAVDRALRSAELYGDLVAVNLGKLAYPDLVAEVADLMLSYEGARYVLCCGRFGTRAFLSLRTDPTENRAGSLMRQTIGAEGAAGGHGTMAGGRLHAPFHEDAALQVAFGTLIRRFIAAAGVNAVPGAPSIPLVEP
jgi:nanoRNase/pAp phosphatase (c-di-AMP/oligoRNAs hydrolase)